MEMLQKEEEEEDEEDEKEVRHLVNEIIIESSEK